MSYRTHKGACLPNGLRKSEGKPPAHPESVRPTGFLLPLRPRYSPLPGGMALNPDDGVLRPRNVQAAIVLLCSVLFLTRCFVSSPLDPAAALLCALPALQSSEARAAHPNDGVLGHRFF